jgi:4-hydroxybenzoate polyprenyltransferase
VTVPLDALPLSFVDRAPDAWKPYLRLSRFDRPIGFWLLALPCFMGQFLGRGGIGFGLFDLLLLALWAMGAVAMRGAGCSFNDYVDRDIDAKVARTAGRPLPSGQVTPRRALIWTVVQCLVGLGVLLLLPRTAQIVALLAIPMVAAYPFMKRITWWPQVWLGLTFNWGVLVGYAAVMGRLDWPALWLYLACVCWTVGYDTIYAQQDIEDDALVGVKSTTKRGFGSNCFTAFAQALPFWGQPWLRAVCLPRLWAGVGSWHLAFIFGDKRALCQKPGLHLIHLPCLSPTRLRV